MDEKYAGKTQVGFTANLLVIVHSEPTHYRLTVAKASPRRGSLHAGIWQSTELKDRPWLWCSPWFPIFLARGNNLWSIAGMHSKPQVSFTDR